MKRTQLSAPRTIEQGTHLLAVHKHVHTLPEPVVYPTHGRLQMRLQVRAGAVEDVETVALELDTLRSMPIHAREPRCVKHLDESADGVRREQGGVEDGGEGPEVECARPVRGAGREDEVHGRAHRLHDLGRQVVEANHVCEVLRVVVRMLYWEKANVVLVEHPSRDYKSGVEPASLFWIVSAHYKFAIVGPSIAIVPAVPAKGSRPGRPRARHTPNNTQTQS